MKTGSVLAVCLFLTATFIDPVHLLVPPKTPVLTGFEPAAVGSYRELVCDASQPGAGTITYKWYKNSIDGNGPIGTSQKYVYNLVVNSDIGKYKCRASNSAGTRDSEWGDLYVYTPCSLYTVSVTPAKPANGSTFTLNCYISNPSGFTVNWLRRADASSAAKAEAYANAKICQSPDDRRYSWSSCSPPSWSSLSRTFNLQVTNAKASDSAYWICQDIGLSCISNPVKPVVQELPGTPQIIGFPSGRVSAGTQLNLKCVALPIGDTYDWYKDGTKVSTSLCYDFQVTKASAGIYKCVAINDVGSATSSDKTLGVYYKADSVVVSSGNTSSHVGEKDTFTCTVAGGSPTPTVKLYFKRSGGTPVDVTQGQDKVMAKEDNQAEYYCEAKITGYPTLDMTSSRKTYNVTFPHTKVSFLNDPTAAVQVGQEKKFTCETDESNPTTYIKWYQTYFGSSWQDITTGISSSEINGAYGGKISISERSVTATKATNGATQRCSSHYYLSGHTFTSHADTKMYVKWSATEFTMVKKPSVPITVGNGVTIKCETDSSNSGSPETISWYRNGQQVTSGVTPSTRSASDGGTIYISQLTFTARKEDNHAKYECEINDQASFRNDVTMTVYFPPKGIQLSETSISVKEGVAKTIACSTTSSSNPAVSGVSVKKKLGSTEVDVTGTSRVTNGAYYGKDVSIDIKLDTNRKDNGAQYICLFTYASTTFRETATVNVQFNPSRITMIQSPPTTVHESQLITIICETDSANPVANIQFNRKRPWGTWEELTSGITSEDRTGVYNGMLRKSTLTVAANRSDSQAVFKCEMKEGSFQVEQTTKTVNVYFPPTVQMSSSPTHVKEGDTLTLTCTARGGNPTQYTYKWFYKNKEIPNVTSKDYKITNIKYTQSGSYRCQAINYPPPGGIADGSLNIDILYKAKWNPEFPEVFTVASKTNTPMKFVLRVIANPSPTMVTWFLPNKTTINNTITFTAAKVNDTAYTLSKASVGVKDYGNYTVNATNAVGISTFTYVLEKPGAPDPPCCLRLVSTTAVSLTLTFTSNFAGGSVQTFTVENKTYGRNVWDIAVEGIADPGFGITVTQKIPGLDSDTKYEFRVKATNADGDSAYGDILEAKTEAVPNVTLTVNRKDNLVTASWPKLFKEYTKILIKFCPKEGGSCDYHDVADPTRLNTSFPVMEGNSYNYYMIIFDGEDQVFVSAAVVAPTPSSSPSTAAIGGGVGGFLLLLVIIAVVLATVFILKKRRAKNDRAGGQTGGDTMGSTGTLQTSETAQDPVYMNVVNKAFERDGTGLADPEYDEPHQDRLGDREERVQEVLYNDRPVPNAVTVTTVAQKTIQDLSVEEFKQWLLSKHVTQSTYQILAKNGLDKAAIFAMLEREEDIKALRIKPLGQEIVVRRLVESFRSGAETKGADGHAEKGAYMELENPYEELNITRDVIADQVYSELKPEV